MYRSIQLIRAHLKVITIFKNVILESRSIHQIITIKINDLSFEMIKWKIKSPLNEYSICHNILFPVPNLDVQ